MKKPASVALVLLALLLLIPATANAQRAVTTIGDDTDLTLGGDFVLMVPLGKFFAESRPGPGLGILARAQFAVLDPLHVTVRTGYIGGIKSSGVGVSYWPMLGGVKYYFSGRSHDGFYVGGETGWNLIRFSTAPVDTGFGSFSASSSIFRLPLVVSAGYEFGDFDFGNFDARAGFWVPHVGRFGRTINFMASFGWTY